MFTLAVIANFVNMAMLTPVAWFVYAPLPPLFLMLVTGLYMFVLPYTGSSNRA
jgi:ATP/ADP translocase